MNVVHVFILHLSDQVVDKSWFHLSYLELFCLFICAVVALKAWTCPPAVVWCVVLVRIDAVQSGSFWSDTHVAKEVLKSLPLLAVGDALASVVFVLQVIASSLHVSPAAIGAGPRHAMGSGPVSNDPAPLLQQAATRLDGSKFDLVYG